MQNSEWAADPENGPWKALFDKLKEAAGEGAADTLKQRLQNLCWWEQVKGIDGFPGSPMLYYWNPVAFVEHMLQLRPTMYFPLAFIPAESYKDGQRAYGSRRDDGKRKHAGCDLDAPEGTKIYAIADGTIISHYEYYLGTCKPRRLHHTLWRSQT